MNNHTPYEGSLFHDVVDEDIDSALQANEPITLLKVRDLIELGIDETSIDTEGRMARDIAAAYGVKALQLYDSVSRVDWSNEPTLQEFSDRCRNILESSGCDCLMIDQDQMSISAASYFDRIIILVGQWYGWRHDVNFAKRLIVAVRERLESTKQDVQN